MKTLKEIIEKRKAKAQFEKEAIIKADFSVVERNGSIWLTHDGIAFMKMSDYATADEISALLNKARECAVEFDRI